MKEHYQAVHGNKHQDCHFGMKFNLKKKTFKGTAEELATRNRPTKKGGSLPPPPPSGIGGTILLDFTGHIVTGTSWNYQGDIDCLPANLSSAQVDEILATMQSDYSPFNVVITADETVFNATPIGKRVRVVFTESWQWYGQAGGTSFVNSFHDGSDSPCFVFTSLLNYNTRRIRAAGSHEAGHTLGLLHQSSYDANCIKSTEYNEGNGVNSPTMGFPYTLPNIWWDGPNPYGCHTEQIDVNVIASVVGLK